jgi:putative two-component system response regulator
MTGDDQYSDYERQLKGSGTDSLTGLFNHGIFQICLDRQVSKYDRHAEPFALCLINIDSFSRYNECHGFVQADLILKHLGAAISENARKVDLAARYSGDEFMVIMPGTDGDSAYQAMERIRNSIVLKTCESLTISSGIAVFPSDASTKQDLIKKTRAALMQAKLNGKNRVACYQRQCRLSSNSRARVLVVDDEPLNLKLLEGLLVSQHYEVLKADNGAKALQLVSDTDIDLILLDVMMPGMNGFEVCRRLKTDESTRIIPIVLVTALDDVDSRVKGIEAGAEDFITKPPNKMELLARTQSLIKLKKANKNLTSIENVLFSLARAVEAKDQYTQGHIDRVSSLAVLLGQRMGMEKPDLDALRFGGQLHDIGKLGIPGDILNKPAPLDEDEWEIVKTHPGIGHRICLPLKDSLGAALDVIRHHHEKLDGSGYPDGLKGEAVSMPARIMSVADIYDALTTDRPYRKGLPMIQALHILRKEAAEGKLDATVVETLAEIILQ